MSKYPSGISYDEFYAALDAYCDAMIRAALEVGVDAVCAEAHHLCNDDPKTQRAMLGAIDAIRYLKDDAKAVAAIKARAGTTHD